MDAQIRAVLKQVNTLFYYLSEEAEAFLNSSADDKAEYNTDIVKLMNSSRFTKMSYSSKCDSTGPDGSRLDAWEGQKANLSMSSDL